jgi:alkaline phosphatase
MRRPLLAIVACLLACGDNGVPRQDPGDAGMDGAAGPPKRAVILFIGDGMGQGQVDAASLYATGFRGRLFMHSLPVSGKSSTASLSGITDSAASATTMATGQRTWNGVIGEDRDQQPVQTLVELAHEEGLAAGLVTTTELTHATPAAFSAHEGSRGEGTDIATDQVMEVHPEVMLGGGMAYYRPAGPGSLRTDSGLLGPLTAAGYTLVADRTELAAARPDRESRLFGAFAQSHLAYTDERADDSPEPTLAEMTRAALAHLGAKDEGFFLMVEGGRIDHAGHANRVDLVVGETLAFDEAIRAAVEWADAEPNREVTIVVTADHECGGLTVVQPRGKGALPLVTWRWGNHTNGLVPIFARGPRTGIFQDEVRDHAWVWALLAAAVRDVPFEPPPEALFPDGRTGDLRWLAATQETPSGFGAGLAQLDALRLDADATGLAIGVDGLFAWGEHAIVVLVDTDFGAGTGTSSLAGALADTDGLADSVLTASTVGAPGVPGFGAEVAVVVIGGTDAAVEEQRDDVGVRLLGTPDELGHRRLATNFADGTRTRDVTTRGVSGLGWEGYVPWSALYGGPLPANASLAIAVVLVSTDGSSLSNQALPSFPAGTPNPAGRPTPLPGVVRFDVDADGDAIADGDTPPVLLR